MSENELIIVKDIQDRIYTIRGVQVMIDSDLAELYGVETKSLNRAVKRNMERFPDKYMFQLTKEEYEKIRYQYGTIEMDGSLRFQTLLKGLGKKCFAFSKMDIGAVDMLSKLEGI